MVRFYNFCHNLCHFIFILYSRPLYTWTPFHWYLLFLVISLPLVLLFAGKRTQPYFRNEIIIDSVYWLMLPGFYDVIYGAIYTPLNSSGPIRFLRDNLHLASLPVLVQFALQLLIISLPQYWIHRAFHSRWLWKFHAIHHSSLHVDWLCTARWHPVNYIVLNLLVGAFLATLGFGIEAFYILGVTLTVFAILQHSNLNWTYGPFKHLMASPVFHRWYHIHIDEGGNRNFSTLPFLDLLLGTYYMPKDKRPEVFGTPHDAITGNFFDQLIYPFKNSLSSNPQLSVSDYHS